MKIHGSCHCGYIKFEGGGGPGEGHDLPLHRLPAEHRHGVPRPTFRCRATTFKMLSGEPTIYIKTTAESGNPRAQAFCPKCGSPIYSTTPGDGPKPSYMVRVGILRERDQLAPKKQIWWRSARPWVGGIGALRRNEKRRAAIGDDHRRRT